MWCHCSSLVVDTINSPVRWRNSFKYWTFLELVPFWGTVTGTSSFFSRFYVVRNSFKELTFLELAPFWGTLTGTSSFFGGTSNALSKAYKELILICQIGICQEPTVFKIASCSSFSNEWLWGTSQGGTVWQKKRHLILKTLMMRRNSFPFFTHFEYGALRWRHFGWRRKRKLQSFMGAFLLSVSLQCSTVQHTAW